MLKTLARATPYVSVFTLEITWLILSKHHCGEININESFFIADHFAEAFSQLMKTEHKTNMHKKLGIYMTLARSEKSELESAL